MVYGDITVTTDEGAARINGYAVKEGTIGKKRAGYTHSETKWLTLTPCPEMPLDDCLDYVTSESFGEIRKRVISEKEIIDRFQSQPSYRKENYPEFKKGYLAALCCDCLEDLDKTDYFCALKEFGFTEETARIQSENTDDQIAVVGGIPVQPTTRIQRQTPFP